MPDNTTPITDPAASSFTPLPDETTPSTAFTGADLSGGVQTVQANDAQTTLASAGIPTGVKTIAIAQADIEKYKIPADWIEKDPALIALILSTESMKEEERKYWFQLMPVMNDEQVTKLRGILQKEKDQLAALDAKYANEVERLNSSQAGAWKAEEATKKRRDIEQREAAHEAEEKKDEEDILNQIENF